MMNLKSLDLEQTQHLVTLIDDFEHNKYDINEEIRELKRPYGVSKQELLKAVFVGLPIYLITLLIASLTDIIQRFHYTFIILDIRTPSEMGMTAFWLVVIPLLLYFMVKGEQRKRYFNQQLLFNLIQEYEVNQNNVVVLKRMIDSISQVPKQLIDKTTLDEMVSYKKTGLLKNDEKIIQIFIQKINEQAIQNNPY